LIEPYKKLLSNIRATTQEETHCKVMDLLENNPDLIQRELAQSLGVNYCLKALVEKAQITQRNINEYEKLKA
jgi:hypothetical protein